MRGLRNIAESMSAYRNVGKCIVKKAIPNKTAVILNSLINLIHHDENLKFPAFLNLVGFIVQVKNLQFKSNQFAILKKHNDEKDILSCFAFTFTPCNL